MPEYVLGHLDPELNRLAEQSRLYETGTRDMLRAAGVKRGNHVLDAGCGKN